MKKSEFSFDQWLNAANSGSNQTPREVANGWSAPCTRSVLFVHIGDEIRFSEGSSYFGSGGYSTSVYWASPDGECPIEEVSSETSDNGFRTAKEGIFKFTRPGAVKAYAGDCIGSEGRTFLDVIWICQ